MSVSMALLRNHESKSSAKMMTVTKCVILLMLQCSWSKDGQLPISILAKNLDDSTKVLLHAAIGELREAGLIDLVYCEGWSVSIRLTNGYRQNRPSSESPNLDTNVWACEPVV
jgi:hypothetical protein